MSSAGYLGIRLASIGGEIPKTIAVTPCGSVPLRAKWAGGCEVPSARYVGISASVEQCDGEEGQYAH